jgi:hypothetical protein
VRLPGDEAERDRGVEIVVAGQGHMHLRHDEVFAEHALVEAEAIGGAHRPPDRATVERVFPRLHHRGDVHGVGHDDVELHPGLPRLPAPPYL